MKTMELSKFGKQCLFLLDDLNPEGILITKQGRPIAKLVPVDTDCSELIGSMKEKIKVHDKIFSTGVTWQAQDQCHG
jgi:hypothetical protein